jgi:cytochrome c oxidase assembly factor 2
MHYLHPRSRTTGTLFTTTLAISFLVVGIPHLLPCPVDRRQYADTIEMPDGTIRRRRRKQQVPEGDGDNAETMMQDAVPVVKEGRPDRECPVPKPGGLVGRIMGFDQREKEVPPQVIVNSLRARQAGAEKPAKDRLDCS